MHKLIAFSGVRGKKISLILIFVLIFELFSPLINNLSYVSAADEEVVKYTINSTSEIEYRPRHGEYGQITYRKKHYTTGSGIRYYTQYFIISIGEADLNTDLSCLDPEISEKRLVSADGSSSDYNEADFAGKDFYWYEDKTPDINGYITTSYVLDGKIFYDLINRAAQKGVTGKIYIHHVFAVAGGTDINSAAADAWHKDNRVVNNSPYYVYNDLLKLWWNDTEKTHSSQKECLNVQVPYSRRCSCIVAYHLPDGSIVRTESVEKGFDESWNVTVPAELLIEGKKYTPAASVSGNYKKEQKTYVPKYLKNYSKNLIGMLGLSNVNSDFAMVEEEKKRINADGIWTTKAINETTLPGGFKAGKTNTFTYYLSHLNEKVAPWEIILYIPLEEKAEVTPTPVIKPTATPKPTQKVSATPKPTQKVSATPKPTQRVSATPKPTQRVSATPKPTQKVSATPKPTQRVSATPKPTQRVSATPKPTQKPTATPKPPSDEPVVSPDEPSIDEKADCCHVIIKYFTYDTDKGFIFLKDKKLINPKTKNQTFELNCRIETELESYLLYSGKCYEPYSLSGILYGNNPKEIWNGTQYLYEIPSEFDGVGLMGILDGSYDGTADPSSVSFVTQNNGKYYSAYVMCYEVREAANFTIHYIDADTGENINTYRSKTYLNDNYATWKGIGGSLVWGYPIKRDVLQESVYSEDGLEYTPVYYTDTGTEKVHTGRCYGTINHWYYGWGTGNCTSFYCSVCGKLTKLEFDLEGRVYDTEIYDNGNMRDPYHSYKTISYPQKFKTSFHTRNVAYLPDRMKEGSENSLSVPNTGMNSDKMYIFDSDTDTLWLSVGEDVKEGESVFSFSPSKIPDFNVLILYVPCVLKPKEDIPVSIRYIHLESGRIICEKQGGSAKTGENYSCHTEQYVMNDGTFYYREDAEARISFEKDSPLTEYEKGSKLTENGAGVYTYDKEIKEGTEYVCVYIPVAPKKAYGTEKPEAAANVVADYMDDAPLGVIKADRDEYNVSQAIPGTEYIYSEISFSEYLLRIEFKNITGIREYPIKIKQRVHYIDGETGLEKATDTISGSVVLERPYSYWKIKEYALYKAVSGTVSTEASPDLMKVQPDDIVLPEINKQVYSASEHILDPEYEAELVLDDIYVYDEAVRAFSEKELYEIADFHIENPKVRNDFFRFGKYTLSNASWREISTEEPVLKGIKEGNRITLDTSLVQIPGYTRNSEFPSTGYVRYELADKVGAPPQVIHKTIENINNVKVHTPIYCELFIEEDNLQYVQALEADKEMANAVIGRSDSYGSSGKENISCDFTIRIKTNGNHIGAKGYGLRDYSEYIKVYDVLFPFDVYAEVNGALREEDYLLIPAGTWNPVYNSYYVPEWVQEGVYSVKLRAKAVNADENDSGMQTKANISDIYYITVDEKKIRISGKMYGLTLYSVNSEVSEWRNVFTLSGKIKNTDLEGFKDGTFDSGFDASFRYYYMSGLNNELGLLQTLKNINGQVLSKNEKYRLPLLSGSSPVSPENGMLKSGYVWNFSINTVGSLTAADGARLSVIPSFYWISEDGRSREKVDVWYSAQISGVKYPYVKIGSEADKKNVFSDYASSSAMGIPNTYLRLSVRVRNNRKYYDKNCTLYSYQQILAGSEFKLFTNSEYARIYSRLQKNCSEERLLSLKQTWYFKYSMPDIYHVCKAGYDVEGYLKLNKSLNFGEDFWKKEGYLAVNFDIGVYDDKGKLIMTYLNTVKNHEAGMCNMWELEGFEKNRYNAGTEMKLEYGDVIVLRLPGTTKDFQSGKPDPATNKSEDYIVDHLN